MRVSFIIWRLPDNLILKSIDYNLIINYFILINFIMFIKPPMVIPK